MHFIQSCWKQFQRSHAHFHLFPWSRVLNLAGRRITSALESRVPHVAHGCPQFRGARGSMIFASSLVLCAHEGFCQLYFKRSCFFLPTEDSGQSSVEFDTKANIAPQQLHSFASRLSVDTSSAKVDMIFCVSSCSCAVRFCQCFHALHGNTFMGM